MSSHRKHAQSHGTCSSCEVLKKEIASLKSELETLKIDYTQLIKETSVENFSERRVNLLKAHILQLERQLLILSDALEGQVQLLSDLQVYGEALEYKIKNKEPIAEDAARLRKLNQRLKKVSCPREDVALPLVYTGGLSKPLTILDSLSNKDNISLREISWMESKLSKLHSQLRRLHTSLSLLPKCTPVLPTLKEVDPLYKLLDHSSIEVSGTMDLLSTVTQELMTLSLAIPGQTPHKLTNEYITDTEMVKKELSSAKDKKITKTLLETILRTLEIIESRQADQLKAQEAEIIRQKESMEDYVKYIEELFLSIKTSHKEFMRDLYHKIDLPLKDLTAHYYHLKASNSSLEILESYIYELNEFCRRLKQTSERDSESLLGVFRGMLSIIGR
ncbi:PREDICTED: uncharacterized protein LOC100633553 isoform X1 [Amphimedon queenslandica]|uniref:Uncharacterized protein n=2 Tax=Amphimedon queenslandica TaxID=400682 RepID=A0AAN0IE89_AMPQE|nr:PREDICTED: uncharacterized protein LOC100633553 isoform X1 [Amphimedon queenslandica]|eukprot:XP_003386637.2 PREDICTED: uncharacterized protein LOC100633553 isoform X1 [Amphimedon queenslandica]